MPLQEEPDLNANRTSLHGTHRHTHTHNRRCASVGVGLSRRSRVRGPCERQSGETDTPLRVMACDEPDLPGAPTFRSLRL